MGCRAERTSWGKGAVAPVVRKASLVFWGVGCGVVVIVVVVGGVFFDCLG